VLIDEEIAGVLEIGRIVGVNPEGAERIVNELANKIERAPSIRWRRKKAVIQ